LKDCRRINLIVGENGVGKTSLLEGLFLGASGNVEVALRLRHFRGYEGLSGSHNELEEFLWRDLFHMFDKRSQVTISLTGTEFRNRSLTIKFNEDNPNILAIDRKSKQDSVDVAPVTFDWIGPKGRRSIVKPKLKEGKIELPSPALLPEETFFFSSGHNYSAAETAKRFSDLSKSFKQRKVIERFMEHFPAVTDLSIEIVGGSPMICVKYGNLPEKVPLNLVSSGMSKLASILFAIAGKQGNVLLVDEIENGLFHKRLPVLWESLLDFCIANESQVFASTHSAECIAAAAKLAEKYPDEFSIIQPDSKGGIHQFGGQSFHNAIREHIEIR
jgi:predicted ATPase